MKRVEVPATETDTGEPAVQVVDHAKDLRRLAAGVAVFEATMRQMSLLGFQGEHDPDDVRAARERIHARVELPGQEQTIDTMKDYAATLTTKQAAIVHRAAQFILSRAAEQLATHEALLYEGAPDQPLHPYSWHGRPYDIWEHFVTALDPAPAPSPA